MAVTTLDPIPGRHPRLPDWARAFRRAGWSLRAIAQLFDAEPARGAPAKPTKIRA